MNDDALTPDQAAMLADALDLEHHDLIAVDNGIMSGVHSPEACEQRDGGCWIHRPTQGWPLAGRPVVFDSRTAVAYRRCEHDVLHPDIDAVAYLDRYRSRYQGRGVRPGDAGYHPACDGCCLPEKDR